MLEKPKFLTGEVKEFIDEFAKYWHNTKLDYKQISFYLFETSNFYNQPFETAMIKKYFRGWECVLSDTEPRTLNHFISDCIRAGIKLEWRE